MAMRVTFWGVRDAFPVTGLAFSHYGGDTSCIEIETDDARVILDAGAGLRALAKSPHVKCATLPTSIVLSNLTLDRLLGLPHFLKQHELRLLSTQNAAATTKIVQVLLSSAPAVDRSHLRQLSQLTPEALRVRPETFVSAHLSGDAALVIVETRTRKLCYVTAALPDDAVTADLARAARGANLLIFNASSGSKATSTDTSTWEFGAQLKRQSGAALLAVTGHPPDCSDSELSALAARAASRFPNTFFARVGARLDL